MNLQPGQRVLVMGMARSGAAVARLLLRHGCTVVVNERRDRGAEEFEADELEQLGAELVFGGHPLALLDTPFDFLVKNPGIPYDVPLLAEAARRDIPIYTEIEVASWLTQSPMLAITGSNGKTTTTTLVGEILTEARLNCVVAGNIGTVLSGVVETVRPDQPIVLEVSSFQLMGTDTFHPRVAALLNLYPSHLDYHQSFEAYTQAKLRMFRNMTENDIAVLNRDSEEVRLRAKDLRARIVWFSKQPLAGDGACVENGQIVFHRDGVVQTVMAVTNLAIKGEHNLENALAATAISMSYGVPAEVVADVLSRFRGVEHRQEFVRTVDGVDYYNDSKATNPTGALRGLRLFAKNVVWIAGGLNRGDDFSVLSGEIRDRVKSAVLLGQSAERLHEVCMAAGVKRIEHVSSIEQAVAAAHRLAEPGDVVLLSPSCASWDMFASFEERGRMFKEAVHTL